MAESYRRRNWLCRPPHPAPHAQVVALNVEVVGPIVRLTDAAIERVIDGKALSLYARAELAEEGEVAPDGVAELLGLLAGEVVGGHARRVAPAAGAGEH